MCYILICNEMSQRCITDKYAMKSVKEDFEFVKLLKVCSAKRDLNEGAKLHADICKSGVLERNPYVASALITMYARCGDLRKAQEVLDGLRVRNSVSCWNALIAGYTQHGKDHEALDCFGKMQSQGVSPSGVTFISVLKACGSTGDIEKGKAVHDEIGNRGPLLQRDVTLGTALVDMYVKCGLISKAEEVFYNLPSRNLVSWSTLIGGYTHQRLGHEALNCYEMMKREGFVPDAITLTSLLKACGSVRAIKKGEQIHHEIIIQGFLYNDVVLGNALIDMYVKFDMLAKAQEILEELHVRDVISWNTVIAGYVQKGHWHNALECFEHMKNDHITPNAFTFISILRVCGYIGAIHKGKEIHDEIVNNGLFHREIEVGNALVFMYAKSGNISQAHGLLNELPIRNVLSWNTLIIAYVLHEQCDNALKCFAEMQREGVSPNATTLKYILKACGSTRTVDIGKEVYDEIVTRGILETDIMVGTALVDMYAKCGMLAKAQQVMEELPVHDAISWNALIAGYARQEQGHKALKCLAQMQGEGCSPDAFTFTLVLKACNSLGDLSNVEQIHDEIVSRGLLENDVVLGNSLVDIYARCGFLAKAEEVLDELPIRDVISWNALIRGYLQHEYSYQALTCLERMKMEGVSPDAVTLTYMLKACSNIGDIDYGRQMHDIFVNEGLLEKDIVLGNALIYMYVKFGMLEKANEVLHKLPMKNVVSWNALIAGYAEDGQGYEAWNCFEKMRKDGIPPDTVTFTCVLRACGNSGLIEKGRTVHDEIVCKGLLTSDVVLGNALIEMYAKCGVLTKANQVLQELPFQDVGLWNALIAGYVQHDKSHEALDCFQRIRNEGLVPDVVTFACILKACSNTSDLQEGKEIHNEVVSRDWLHKDIVILGPALVDMYIKCHSLSMARLVLYEHPDQVMVSSWNVVITGFIEKGHCYQGLQLIEQMQKQAIFPNAFTYVCALKACGSMRCTNKGKETHSKIISRHLLEVDIVLANALIDMYAKCGVLEKSQQVADCLPLRDVISWNTLITAYVQHEQCREALTCFEKMKTENAVSPNSCTFTSILKACGATGAIETGIQIHDVIVSKRLLEKDVILGNALVDMYIKCGSLTKAQDVLDNLPVRDVISWNSLIGGFAQQGQIEQALKCFKSMQIQGFNPDAVTFLSVLSACSTRGLVKQAESYFHEMSKYDINPTIEHHTCMVYVYGLAGRFDMAMSVVKNVPRSDCLAVWLAVLSACRKLGNVELGRFAFEKAIQLDNTNAALYNLMANIYADAGMLEDKQKLEEIRTENVLSGKLEAYWGYNEVNKY